jgi:hypothetical protein
MTKNKKQKIIVADYIPSEVSRRVTKKIIELTSVPHSYGEVHDTLSRMLETPVRRGMSQHQFRELCKIRLMAVRALRVQGLSFNQIGKLAGRGPAYMNTLNARACRWIDSGRIPVTHQVALIAVWIGQHADHYTLKFILNEYCGD